jgi:outer membrane murein-binding lipoprotein Lpp
VKLFIRQSFVVAALVLGFGLSGCVKPSATISKDDVRPSNIRTLLAKFARLEMTSPIAVTKQYMIEATISGPNPLPDDQRSGSFYCITAKLKDIAFNALHKPRSTILVVRQSDGIPSITPVRYGITCPAERQPFPELEALNPPA